MSDLMTVTCTTADSDLEASSREAGTAVELTASHTVVKYSGLSSQGEYVQTAVKSHGPTNRDARQFLSELGKQLVKTIGDVQVSLVLFQRISVAVERFCSAA